MNAKSAKMRKGNYIKGHNRLLGSYEGTDGIKTGYTRASGFNLVSSVRRSDRHIVAVVLGGASGARRDAPRANNAVRGHALVEAVPRDHPVAAA